MATNWLRRIVKRITGRDVQRERLARKRRPWLFVEPLEERTLLSTLIRVTTTADVVSATDGVTSLREAVALSNATPDCTISLSAGGGAYHIDPAKGELLITRDTAISGFNDTIQADGPTRVFHVVGNINVAFTDFNVTGGQAVGDGGALLVEGGSPTVSLQEMTFSNNSAVGADGADGNQQTPSGPAGYDGMPGYGGAIYFRGNTGGSLTIENCKFINNVAVGGTGGTATEATGGNGGQGLGGAVYLAQGVPGVGAASLSVQDSTFAGNEARGGIGGDVVSDHPLNIYYSGNGGDAYGGAVTAEGGGVTLTNATFEGNRALGGNGFSQIEFGSTDRNAVLGSATGPGNNGTAYGGAVVNRAGTLTVTGSSFLTNVAAGGRLDLPKPFTGGFGGRSTVHGGNGGSAYGGGIEAGLGNLVVDRSGFLGNMVQGAPGGVGGGSAPVSISSSGDRFIEHDGQNGGDGGVGGGASGAAISAGMLGSDGFVTITQSLFTQNGAIGGDGGGGGNGKPNDNGVGGKGGNGAAGGGATGTLSLRDGGGPYRVSDCLFSDNRLAGGNGGQGGQGGYGTTSPNAIFTGGSGGDGGNGGFAAGGGISVTLVNGPTTVELQRDTITANVIAGGWGGTAGHGADSSEQDAGSGGRGGNGGYVSGAGVSMTGFGLTAIVDHSTIYGNLGLAGDGGNGGSGGSSDYQGGNAGNGGNGGAAQGGGLAVATFRPEDTLTLTSSTIAGNVLEAGGAGRGGNAGSGYLANPNERTLAFSYGGRIKSIGSGAIFLNAGFNPFNPSASVAPSGGGIDAIGDVAIANDPYNPATKAAAASHLVGGGLLGEIGGDVGGGLAGVVTGLELAQFTVGTFGTGILAGASLGLLGADTFLIVGLLSVEAGFVFGLGIGYAIQSGSLEAGFRIAYDQAYQPAVGRYDMATLFFGGTPDTSDNNGPPLHLAGRAGTRGTAGTAQGGGVYVIGLGREDIGRTIVADNRTITVTPDASFDGLSQAAQRDLLNLYVTALQAAPSPVTSSGAIVVLPGGNFDQRVLFEDLTSRPTDPALGGFPFNHIHYDNDDFTQGYAQVVSHGANFIGGTASTAFNQPLDQAGTFASPLALKSVGRLAFNGGPTPTLKLRDDSPARNAGPLLAAAETAQNGYTWAAGTRADIGAWGGAANQAPTPTAAISFDVPQGGSVKITADQILSQMADANGDGLTLTSVDTSALHGAATLSKSGNLVDTATNVLRDSSTGVVNSINYTLAGVSFSGDETFTVVVSDGVATTPVTVTLHVLPLISGVQVGPQTGAATYGDATHTVTFSVAGLRGASGEVSGASYSLSSADLPAVVIAGANFSPASVSSAGSNPIPATTLSLSVPNSLAAGTYSFTVALTAGATSVSGTGTLTVGQRALTITASDQSKTYGDTLGLGSTAFTTSAVAAGVGLVNGDTVTGMTLSSAGTPATANVAGSPYAITADGATGTGLGNYQISYALGRLTVNCRALTVTADNQTKITGEANPTLTASYSGFAPGEWLGVLAGSLTLTTAATAGSAPGTYGITPSGLTSGNYAITFVAGALTVLSYSQASTSLQSQVDTAGLDSGTQNSLDSQLQAAIASFNGGNTKAGVNQLGAFINYVSAQRGKKINAALADALIAYAKRIISVVG
jgi:hypothetical protein